MNEVTKEKPEHKSGRQNGAIKTANQVMNKALNVNS